MSRPASGRSVMIGVSSLILIGAAVIWWDAGMNEGFATKPVLLAVCATLAGITFLFLGLRKNSGA